MAPFVIIVGATTHFKRKKMFALAATRTLVILIEVHVMVFSLPKLPTLLADEATSRTFTKADAKDFTDIFLDLALGYNPFDFLTPMDKERQLIKAMFGKRMGPKEASLEVVRTLEMVLTIPSDISTISNESFHFHLALTTQMTFNVREKIKSYFFFALV